MADPTEMLPDRIQDFINREAAIIKAEGKHSYTAAAWVESTNATFLAASSTNEHYLPLLSMFLGQGETISETLPFAEPGHSIDLPPLGPLERSQSRVIQNFFNHQVSLVHAPAGSALQSTIVAVAEAVLREAPQTKILICGYTDTAVDKIADGFVFRENLCDFRFHHLHLQHGKTSSLEAFRLIVCTYSSSWDEWPKEGWTPHVLIAADAGILANDEFLMLLSKHFTSLTRLVLLGDHRQLGPYAKPLRGKTDGHKSVFEKLMEERWPSCMLDVDHVTHSDLCSLRSKVFYGHQLQAARRTGDPGLFLSKMLERLAAGLQIVDERGKATRITSFAHFFDIDDPTAVNEQPQANFVDVLVRTLLSTGACQMSQIMVVSGSDSSKVLLSRNATTGWDKVPIHTVQSAQGLTANVAIFCLPRSHEKMLQSPMCTNRAACVITSLAIDMILFVGKWSAVFNLPHNNDFQRTMIHMDQNVTGSCGGWESSLGR
ncbi:AAA domain-containing protein [Cladophialophora immunda]|nr:AAA domain-containing protein [Cladophialophora immunda]